MAEPDLYELFSTEFEPDAKTQAAALAAALRGDRAQAGRQRAAGNLGLLTGDRVLGGFGQAQLQQAAQQESLAANREGLLPQAGQFRLTRAMQARQNAAENSFRSQQLGLQREQLGMEQERARTRMENDAKKRGLDVSEGLRKEFVTNPVVRQTQEVAVAWDKIQRAAKQPSAAGDLSLIFGYMKLLDPGSTVREGEFANAQNATGVPGQIVNMYNRALKGERLAPEQRADFMGQAQGLFEAQMARFKPLAGEYARLASEAEVEPSSVVLDLDLDAQPAAGGDLPPDKKARLEELRRKRAEGTLR